MAADECTTCSMRLLYQIEKYLANLSSYVVV